MDGAIKFNVGANTAQFDSAMGRVGNSAKTAADSVKSAFSGLATLLAGGAVVSALTNLLKKMDDVSDGARRIGISTVEFQKIGNAAELVGTSVEAVNKAMIRAGVAASKAAREGGNMAEAFAAAGLEPAQFAAAGLEERINMVAKAQRAANGDAEQMNRLFEAIGVKAAGIDFSSLANEMGNVNAASDETVQALANANDELVKAKTNATIFASTLLAGITAAGEMIGNWLGGGGGLTNAEVDAKNKRDEAIGWLKARKMLLPSDTTLVWKTPIGPGDDVSGPIQVQGPNDLENEKRIAARLSVQEAIVRAKEEEARLAREAAAAGADATSAESERAAKAEETAKIKQGILELDLQIKEAQASGNAELAADLAEYKSLVESAVKYEGDLDEAARDVNATYKERLRLQEEALQKTIAQTEKEVELAEVMAFGTDEEKKKAEWMKVYEDTLAKTGRYDLASRAANARTYEAPKEDSATEDSATSRASSLSGRSLSAEKLIEESIPSWMRADQMRATTRASRWERRASELAAAGLYNKALDAQDKAESIKRQFSERVSDYLGSMGISEPERAAAQQAREGGSSSTGGAAKTTTDFATETTLKLILDKIKERPILVA